MRSILSLFWNICLFRVGPEKVPPVPVLFVLAALVDVLIGVGWQVAVSSVSFFVSFIAVVLVWVAGQALIALLMKFKRLESRIIPTLSAWNGTDAILSCAVIILQLISMLLHPVGAVVALLGYMVIALLIWDALVKGFIFNRALDVSRIQGTALAVAINVVLFWLNKWLLGV